MRLRFVAGTQAGGLEQGAPADPTLRTKACNLVELTQAFLVRGICPLHLLRANELTLNGTDAGEVEALSRFSLEPFLLVVGYSLLVMAWVHSLLPGVLREPGLGVEEQLRSHRGHTG